MTSLGKILLTSAAVLSLSAGAAFAQNDDNSNLLGGTLERATGTVNSTLDSVNTTVNDTVGGVSGTVEGVGATVNDTVGGVGSSVDNSVGGVGTDTDVNDTVGDVTGNQGDLDLSQIATFDNLLSLVNGNSSDIGDIGNISQVQVLDVADVANFDADAFNDVLSGNTSNISALQDSINNNANLSEVLSSNAIDVSDIVAVQNDQNGTLVIFTDSDS